MVTDLSARAKDIASMVPYWDKVDAIVEGYEAVKALGKEMLPKFPDETEAEYKFRLDNSKFTNIYRDVLEGLATKPFEEEVSLIRDEEAELPEDIVDFVEDVDGSGNNLTMFAALTFFNGINFAIDWIFVDYPTVLDAPVLTLADAKAMNLKPFWTHVLAKNVLEVRTDVIGSKEVISYIRILEPAINDKPERVRIFERSADSVVLRPPVS